MSKWTDEQLTAAWDRVTGDAKNLGECCDVASSRILDLEAALADAELALKDECHPPAGACACRFHEETHATLHQCKLHADLEAEVAQLRLNDQKYCERLAWLEAALATERDRVRKLREALRRTYALVNGDIGAGMNREKIVRQVAAVLAETAEGGA